MKAVYKTADAVHYYNAKLLQSMFVDMHVTLAGKVYFRVKYVRNAKHWDTNVTIRIVKVPLADMQDFLNLSHAGGYRVARNQ